MRIYQIAKFQGARTKTQENVLIDTGADISLIPLSLAMEIGAWRTNQTINIVGIHKQSRKLRLGVVHIYFPSLNNIGGRFFTAISDKEQKPIIGMDILRPLGISIDTKRHQLLVRNEVWEAFKTLSAWGVLTYGGIKILEAIFSDKQES